MTSASTLRCFNCRRCTVYFTWNHCIFSASTLLFITSRRCTVYFNSNHCITSASQSFFASSVEDAPSTSTGITGSPQPLPIDGGVHEPISSSPKDTTTDSATFSTSSALQCIPLDVASPKH